MEDLDFLGFLSELEKEFDEAVEGSVIADYKNGNLDEILSGDSRTKDRYIQLKDTAQRLEEKLSLYKGTENELKGKLRDVVRWERATGGQAIHRGFYNPSLTADIVIGNNKRGKLLKRPGKNSKISYKYGFDADDRLIVSISVSEWGECCEYLICEENRVYGIEFSIDGEVSSVSEEVFENTRIKSYAVAYADGRESFFEVHGECFSYDENGCLDESEMLNICYMIFKRSRPEIVTHWIYKFISDDDGFLKKYKMIYDSSPGFQEDDLWFDIKEKRQIN